MASAERIVCVLCGKGHITRQKRDVAFRQWSDKGYIHCRVTIPIDICDHCHANYSWTQESTRYLMMRFSGNMTNDESVRGTNG